MIFVLEIGSSCQLKKELVLVFPTQMNYKTHATKRSVIWALVIANKIQFYQTASKLSILPVSRNEQRRKDRVSDRCPALARV